MHSSLPEKDTVTAILDAAEDMMRLGGYHAASYRDIAERVAIKSASVHYHFPTKEDLGAAVMRRYQAKTLTHLGDPLAPARTARACLERYVAMFRHAQVGECRNCLFGVLAMEAGGLPEPVRVAIREHAAANAAWLRTVYGRLAPEGADPVEAERRAWLTLCAMQGAMAAGLLGGGGDAFERVAETLLAGIET